MTVDMTYVEGGSYTMGDGSFDDNPPHTVLVGSFWIARFETTAKQWREYLNETGTHFQWNNDYWGAWIERGGDDRAPVIYVTWWHAVDFANWMSRRDGLEPAYSFPGRPDNWAETVYSSAYRDGDWGVEWDRSANGYRLPTEAEWEFAARGGGLSEGYLFSGGNDPMEVGWWRENTHGPDASFGRVQPVGLKPANELGLHDLSGNTSEWCWDYYGHTYYESSAGLNPIGPAEGSTERQRGNYREVRVTRGGSAQYPALRVVDGGSLEHTVFHRGAGEPRLKYFIGVRLARNGTPSTGDQ